MFVELFVDYVTVLPATGRAKPTEILIRRLLRN